MQETPGLPLGSHRNEDIALDLMKFIAMTTGSRNTIGSGVGFQGGGAAAKPEDYAAHLLETYGRCLTSAGGKQIKNITTKNTRRPPRAQRDTGESKSQSILSQHAPGNPLPLNLFVDKGRAAGLS